MAPLHASAFNVNHKHTIFIFSFIPKATVVHVYIRIKSKEADWGQYEFEQGQNSGP